MFYKFDEEVQKIIIEAKKEMIDLKHPYVGSEHLFLAILKSKNNSLNEIFRKYNLTYNNFKKEVIKLIGIGSKESEWTLFTPLLKRVVEGAVAISKQQKDDEVRVSHLLSSLFEESEGVAIRVLIYMDIDIDELSKEIIIKRHKKTKNKKKLLIEEFGYDMNEKAIKNEIDPVVCREQELERIIEILGRRTKNNPLLIGAAGVGKTAIIEELSSRIAKNKVPEKLRNKRIIALSMASLIAGTKYRGEFEERINKMLNEVEENDDIILFIDEIHTLVGAGGAEGAIDASNILKPFLARGKIRLIGATTTVEYKKYLEDDRALERRFQTVEISEPDVTKTLKILKEIKPIYEKFHNVKISEDILELIVKLTDKYIYDRKQPDKSIDILDEAAAKTSMSTSKVFDNLELKKINLQELIKEKNEAILNHNFDIATNIKNKQNQLENDINNLEKKINKRDIRKEITKEIVAEIIRYKSNIPIYELFDGSPNKLLVSKNNIIKRVVGQEKIINEIYKVVKRIKLGYTSKNGTNSFLFVGPSGTGKTLLAKEIAKEYYGNNLIKLDMSEYKEEHSISKIIGSPPGYVGYENKTSLLDKIKQKPNSVILLDEIEKANSSIINLFLQGLDDGVMQTSTNEEISIRNCLIIMTTNVGLNNISLGFNKHNDDYVKDKLSEVLGNEILNKIDNIYIFKKLNIKDIKKIINNQIINLKNDFQELNIDIKNKVIDNIITLSEYDKFGARKIEKIIKKRLYDIILDEKIKKNVNITIETV